MGEQLALFAAVLEAERLAIEARQTERDKETRARRLRAPQPALGSHPAQSEQPTMADHDAPCTAPARLSHGLACLVLAACALLASPARATEVHAGVRVGAVQVGVDPRLAISPFASALWRSESGFLFELSNAFTFSPGGTWGVYDRSAAALGYGWPTGHLSVGPALSFYSMPACNFVICDRVNGVAVGGHAVLAYFLAGPLGLSMTGSLDYVGGKSRVLPGGSVVMGTAGIVLKFETSRTR